MKTQKHFVTFFVLVCSLLIQAIAQENNTTIAASYFGFSTPKSEVLSKPTKPKTNVLPTDIMTFDVSGGVLTTERMEIPVSIGTGDSIYTMNFTLGYDTTKLTFDEIEYLVDMGEVLTNAIDGELLFTSFTVSGQYESDVELMIVKFDVKAPFIGSDDLDGTLSLLNGVEVTPVITYAAIEQPIIMLTSPQNDTMVTVGDTIKFNSLIRKDTDVDSVQYRINNERIGSSSFSPNFEFNWVTSDNAGLHEMWAVAYYNSGLMSAKSDTLDLTLRETPIATISSPIDQANFKEGEIITIEALTNDNSTIDFVEFFINGISLGVDNTPPFSTTWEGTIGERVFTAIATDNFGFAGPASDPISITVSVNKYPTVSITSISSGDSIKTDSVISIITDAQDADGSISKVQFFINDFLYRTVTGSPFSVNWDTNVLGNYTLKASATDNNGATTTSNEVQIKVVSGNGVKNSPYLLSNQIKVYPNPVDNNLNISFSTNLAEQIHIEVLNIVGKKMISTLSVNHKNISINTTDFEPGIYVLRVRLNNQIKTFKFLKE